MLGSCISSAAYAFLNDCYFLPTTSFVPLFYKKVKVNFLGNARQDYTWSRLQILLSLQGKLLNYKKLHNIRIDENKIKFSSDTGIQEYNFGECKIFDTTNIKLDAEIKESFPSKYMVYDDFELSSMGGKHRYLEPKKASHDFAKEIHYYTSDRVDGAAYITDCVAESILTREQINDVNYSDSMVRFAVEHHLALLGVQGALVGKYKNGTFKYRKPKVVHKKRVVVLKDCNKYKNTKHVEFLDLNLEEVLFAKCSTGS